MSSDEGGRFEDEDGESEVAETPDFDVPVGAPAGARDAPLLSSGHRFVDGTGVAGTSRVPSAAFEAMFGRTPGGMPAETATVGAFASPSSSLRDLSLSKPVSAKDSGLSVEAADDRGPYAAIPSSTTTSCGAANQPAISQLPVDGPFQSLALPSLLASRGPLSRLDETQLSLSHCAEANSGPATPSCASLASPSMSADYGGSILEANSALAAIATTAVTAALPSLGPSGSRIPEPLRSVAVEQAASMPADSSAYSSAAAFALADRFRGRLVALRSQVDLAEHLGKQLAEVQQRCTATCRCSTAGTGVAAVATAAAAAAAHAAVAAEEREAAERAAEQRAALAASKALAAAKLAARIAEAVASEAAAAKQLAVECAAAELGAAAAAAAAQRAAEEATSSAQTLKAELDVLTVALKDYV